MNYTHAGTVEFLMDADSGDYYFIEVNPRIQVEHTVTEQITGIDLIKAQINIAAGGKIGKVVPKQADIAMRGHALQCRVTTENPENDFAPDYGRITSYRSAAGMGIRLDSGTAYSDAVITPYYDSLLVKVTASAPTAAEACRRMDRALREFRVRGVATNLAFLENVIMHPTFMAGTATTRFIEQTPELFHTRGKRDRATKLLTYIAEIAVNGHPQLEGRAIPSLPMAEALLPKPTAQGDITNNITDGSKQRLEALGAQGFAEWMRAETAVLMTDTTMRDAHQSLFATRMRTADMLNIAPFYAARLPNLFSVECWGGATFDVAMRFLHEDPWQRLRALRQAMPNLLLQMLLRSSNAVGYTNYPDNVVAFFIKQAAAEGIDVFRVFDSLNWVENMRVAMDAVIDTGKLCEGTVCYTADIFDAKRPKYGIQYYVDIAKQLEAAGAHIIGIKDMAGVATPRAIHALVGALRDAVGLPLHFHTHDTSGIAAATVLAAVDAGVDAVDAAMDTMSGLTSQPSLGSIAVALQGSARDPSLDMVAIRDIARYWEGVRAYYAPFAAGIQSSTSEVYVHEMPGGQYTNLREQARAMGLESRWADIAKMYADVNKLFGDIVKVTPTSKVVGDMAIFMVTNDLSVADITEANRDISYPQSVIALMNGELGFPPDGFPADVSRAILRKDPPATYRPGDTLESVDLEAARAELNAQLGIEVDDADLAAYLMYPKVYAEFVKTQQKYGDLSVLPTPIFFYGLTEHQEATVGLDMGKNLIIRKVSVSNSREQGYKRVYFELNGQPRVIRVAEHGAVVADARRKAEDGNLNHIAAPMPGMVVTVKIKEGQTVRPGDALLSIEAMKMETQIHAERRAKVAGIYVASGDIVAAHDLMMELAD